MNVLLLISMKHPQEDKSCFSMNIIDELVENYVHNNFYEDPMKKCTINATTKDNERDLKEAMNLLEANHIGFTKRSKFLELELKGPKPKPNIEEPPLDL